MVIQKKKGEKIICRLHTVPTKVGEFFYLRILLLHKPARSFRSLKTILGVEHKTFQEAAVLFGLFDNVNEAVFAMEEGVNLLYRPAQLRFLFANLLFDIAFPAIDLWKRFCDALCGDCNIVGTSQVDYDEGLHYIDQLLNGRGATLHSFGLPLPSKSSPNNLQAESILLGTEQEENIHEAIRLISTLTSEQTTIFNTILFTIQSRSSENHHVFFIDGPAGCGKTFLVQTLIKYLRGQKIIVIIVGTTALSVLSYPRSRTAHSAFGIPVTEVSEPLYIFSVVYLIVFKSTIELTSTINTNSGQAILLKAAELIIWEELPMANKSILECTDQLFRHLMDNQEAFGGKVFVGIGDFRQVAPVVKGNGPSAVFNASVKSSYLWNHFQLLSLSQPIRDAQDITYSKSVDSIGKGSPIQPITIVNMQHFQLLTSYQEAIHFLFPPEILLDPIKAIERCYLSP